MKKSIVCNLTAACILAFASLSASADYNENGSAPAVAQKSKYERLKESSVGIPSWKTQEKNIISIQEMNHECSEVSLDDLNGVASVHCIALIKVGLLSGESTVIGVAQRRNARMNCGSSLLKTLATLGNCESIEAAAFAFKIKPQMKQDLERSFGEIAGKNSARAAAEAQGAQTPPSQPVAVQATTPEAVGQE